MTERDLIPLLLLGGSALFSALILVMMQALFLEAELRIGRYLLPAVIPLIIFAITLSTLLSGRSLKYAAIDIRTIAGEATGSGSSYLRAITGIILAISFAKILNALLAMNTKGAIEKLESIDSAKILFSCFLIYFFGNVICPSALGSHPTFSHNSIYPLILFSAAYLARQESSGLLITTAKASLLIMMLVSLLVAVIKPDLALQPNYQGWVPALKVRLWGLGSNANSIGPLALVLLLLESMQPSNRSWLRVLTWVVALVVLVLAQSKTVWAAAFLVGLAIFGYHRCRRDSGGVKLGFILCIILLLLAVCFGLLFVDVERILQKLSLTQAGGDISTLTGRTQVWAAAINAWEDAPLFGYGLSAWGAEHRSAIGIPFAFHAHNQLMQSLSVAGGIGAVTIIVYFLALWASALRAAPRTRGVSLGLMLFISIRTISEAPLEMTNLFSGETITHLLLFYILINFNNTVVKPKFFGASKILHN